jgi:hypothetical protein
LKIVRIRHIRPFKSSLTGGFEMIRLLFSMRRAFPIPGRLFCIRVTIEDYVLNFRCQCGVLRARKESMRLLRQLHLRAREIAQGHETPVKEAQPTENPHFSEIHAPGLLQDTRLHFEDPQIGSSFSTDSDTFFADSWDFGFPPNQNLRRSTDESGS